MSIPEKKSRRQLSDVVPTAFDGIQANFCRDPECQNFGVPPRRLDADAENPHSDKFGAYKLFGAVGETVLMCSSCLRQTELTSNEALSREIHRLRTANGILASESCPSKYCSNHHRSVSDFPDHYYNDGVTPSGAPRRGCKSCGKRFTLGDHRRAKRGRKSKRGRKVKRGGMVNKDIVRDLVNRSALNAIMRKLELPPSTLYERINHIHERMVAFEAFKLRALRSPGWKRKYYALATDAQDSKINWTSRHRRVQIQLSTISTAENITGFVLRTDVNFDPTTGDVVERFVALLEQGDFDIPERLGDSHRFVMPSFLRAVADVLRSKENFSKLSRDRRDELLNEIETRFPEVDLEEAVGADRPAKGALISKTYTAAAHFRLILEMLPADAEMHLMSDPEGSFVRAVPMGYVDAIKEQRADFAFVYFDKELSNPKKKARVATYKRLLQQFLEEIGSAEDITSLRRAFIARYANRLPDRAHNVWAEWWALPTATMSEPDKHVGIAYQRTPGTPDEIEARRLDLLDRSSLHAVDSFFNVMRQRVSYLHRAGMSRTSNEHYNAFQPYQPSQLQKIVDIARIYFNWCEARPFRVSRKFSSTDPQPHDPMHDKLDNLYEEHMRRTRREDYSTPAMRMHLATAPIALETILNTDWRTKLATSQRHKGRLKKSSRMRPRRSGAEASQPAA
jgi:hypothetical protein